MSDDTYHDYGRAGADILGEAAKAQEAFPPFASAHEGYAVILEELDELKREVFWGRKRAEEDEEAALLHGQIPQTASQIHLERMRREAIQVGAMALRFAAELVPEGSS